MKRPLLIVVLILAVAGSLYIVQYTRVLETPLAPGEERGEAAETDLSNQYVIEEVAHGLTVPWSLAFTSPERILVTERPGRVRVIENGTLKAQPLTTFNEVSSRSEEGLMGLALHPDYAENHFVYVSLAYQNAGKLFVKVVRFRDEGDRVSDVRTILDRIPAAPYHAGSKLKFGPDRKLYVTTGDATDRALAQDKNSLAGKVLRLNDDGSIPDDNPFDGSFIWSFGHRNPQGIAWHPKTGELYATEHGPSVFDGPAGGDEINHIVKGGNYGWPLVSHEKRLEGTIAPVTVFTLAEAPSGAAFYSGDALPQFTNDFFFGALVGKGLIRVTIDAGNPDRVVAVEKMRDVQFGRIREVIEGPDGALYFTTSNRDGRGDPAPTDDRIFRIRADR